MADNILIADLYCAALPSVRDRPLPTMPERLYAYVWKISGAQQVRLSLLTLLVFPLSLAPIELQRRIIDDAVAGGEVRLLAMLGGLYLAALLLHGGLKYVRNLYRSRIAEGVVRALRLRIVNAESFGAESDDGTKQSVISSEAEKIGAFVGESVSTPLLNAGVVVSIAGYMLIVEPLVAAVAIGFLLPSILFVPMIQRAINELAEEKTTLVRSLGECVLEIGRVESDAKTQAEDESESLTEDIYGLRLRIFTLKYAMKFLNNLVGHLGPLSVLMVGGWLVIRGDTQVGMIVAFISGYERMSNPARDLLNFYRRLSLMRMQYRLVREGS